MNDEQIKEWALNVMETGNITQEGLPGTFEVARCIANQDQLLASFRDVLECVLIMNREAGDDERK